MNQRAFEQQVLEFVRDDYEAPQTVASDIARELGRSVSEQEVRSALLALTASGRVQAYVFESAKGRYVPVASADAAKEQSIWFKATSAAGGSVEAS
jgi:hypothetical protein